MISPKEARENIITGQHVSDYVTGKIGRLEFLMKAKTAAKQYYDAVWYDCISTANIRGVCKMLLLASYRFGYRLILDVFMAVISIRALINNHKKSK